MKHDAIVDQGIPIHERVPIPDDMIPADSRVEIDAKIQAGYFTTGTVMSMEELANVKGRGWEDIDVRIFLSNHNMLTKLTVNVALSAFCDSAKEMQGTENASSRCSAPQSDCNMCLHCMRTRLSLVRQCLQDNKSFGNTQTAENIQSSFKSQSNQYSQFLHTDDQPTLCFSRLNPNARGLPYAADEHVYITVNIPVRKHQRSNREAQSSCECGPQSCQPVCTMIRRIRNMITTTSIAVVDFGAFA